MPSGPLPGSSPGPGRQGPQRRIWSPAVSRADRILNKATEPVWVSCDWAGSTEKIDPIGAATSAFLYLRDEVISPRPKSPPDCYQCYFVALAIMAAAAFGARLFVWFTTSKISQMRKKQKKKKKTAAKKKKKG